MDMVKICGAVVICALTAVLLKQLGTPLHVAVLIAGSIAAVIFVIPKISEIVELALLLVRHDVPVLPLVNGH